MISVLVFFFFFSFGFCFPSLCCILFFCLEHSIEAGVGAALFWSWGNTHAKDGGVDREMVPGTLTAYIGLYLLCEKNNPLFA